jgi:uncharacterized protein YodC (DUF2158 family)
MNAQQGELSRVKPGDLVRLTSGGAKMQVVRRIDPNHVCWSEHQGEHGDPIVLCRWLTDAGELKEHAFGIGLLEKV